MDVVLYSYSLRYDYCLANIAIRQSIETHEACFSTHSPHHPFAAITHVTAKIKGLMDP